MYIVVFVRLLGAIKGVVSLLTLACSSQGRPGARIQSEFCRLMWEIYATSVLLVFLVNVRNIKGERL